MTNFKEDTVKRFIFVCRSNVLKLSIQKYKHVGVQIYLDMITKLWSVRFFLQELVQCLFTPECRYSATYLIKEYGRGRTFDNFDNTSIL
jgi:hypothetical protein